MSDTEGLAVQVNGVKEAADYVAKLRRVGKGLGVYQFDAVSFTSSHSALACMAKLPFL